ncbi:MAG TPA: acyl-CoA dehydrogenase family protein [Candidatus Dormibacteraeota bacterium]|nr:acyl-CoA dehydrogenase family protein [Candidatus Dormibacteraeota bacterium]
MALISEMVVRAGMDQMPSLAGWIAEQELGGLDDPVRAGAAAHDLVELGLLALPQPGAGRTRDRLAALVLIGAADCVLARLAEGHADAVAILNELSAPPPTPGDLWGVWAAQPPGSAGVRAQLSDGEWQVYGDKPYCSGAGACDWALVTGGAEDGGRLFAVALHQPGVGPVDGTWPAIGMAGSDSRTVRFTGARATAVGEPGAYLERPGFWHGAVGVAACWLGGALGVAQTLTAAGRSRPLGPHAAAHLGSVDAAITAMEAVLLAAADSIDRDPCDLEGRTSIIARRTRSVVEKGSTEVIDLVGRALGAAPLSLNRTHSRRVVDLMVYLRQSHAERDLEELGRMTLELSADLDWLTTGLGGGES